MTKRSYTTWPECRCGKLLHSVNARLDELAQRAGPPTEEDVDDLQATGFVSLRTITRCCPDREVRKEAKLELMAAIYAPDWAIDQAVSARGRRRPRRPNSSSDWIRVGGNVTGCVTL